MDGRFIIKIFNYNLELKKISSFFYFSYKHDENQIASVNFFNV